MNKDEKKLPETVNPEALEELSNGKGDDDE
jgi:hypothetical protein